MFPYVGSKERKSPALLLTDRQSHARLLWTTQADRSKASIVCVIESNGQKTYLSEGAAGPLDSGGMRVLQQLHGVVHSWEGRKKVYDDQRGSSVC